MLNSIPTGRAGLAIAAACFAVAMAIAHFAPHPFRIGGALFAVVGLAVLFRLQPSDPLPRKQRWLVMTIVLIMAAAFIFIAGGWLSMFRLLG